MSIDLTQPLEGLRYERRDHVAYITLNRPDRGEHAPREPGRNPCGRSGPRCATTRGFAVRS